LASPADGARQQVLPVPGGPTSSSPWGSCRQPLELLRVLQEVDDLLELGLGLVDAGDILEGDAAMFSR